MLTLCTTCGHLFNGAYDDRLVDYEVDYENSQMFSGRFRDYALELVHDLARRHAIRSANVVEVGGGSGDFLRLLAAESGCHGISFGPSYRPAPGEDTGGIEFVTDYYDERYAGVRAKLLLCRHVLEHFEEPATLLRSVRKALDEQSDTTVYFEVPSGDYILGDRALWELHYQHPSYFTSASLCALFTRAGFEVSTVRPQFDDQFLALEASVAPAPRDATVPAAALAQLRAEAAAFSDATREAIARWRECLSDAAHRKTILWGAGAKGVTFLNLLQPESDGVDVVIDVNPRKHGRFVPGTGHRIEPPHVALDGSAEVVVVANPAYLDEIRAAFVGVGSPTLVTL
ncbi:MAG TPA: class I SAM-dependent methyltransferase [Candidatus Limnocylindria bacterium]|nr:class I SAM-dependent methyltransferase [Candidatus Limnocylindria bacterium]